MMAEVYFCWGGQVHGSIEEVRRELAFSSAVNAAEEFVQDPLDDGARGLHVLGGERLAFACPDPGDMWALHFGAVRVGGSGSTSARPSIGLGRDANTDQGVNLAIVSRGLRVRIGTDTVREATEDELAAPHHWCLAVVEHPTAGEWALYRDGEEIAGQTDVDTSRPERPNSLNLMGAHSAFRDMHYSHIILADEYLGQFSRVAYAPVSADQSPTEWDRSEPLDDHFEHLDAVPHAGDTKYLRSTDFGTETAHRAAVSLPGRQIIAAQPVVMARLEEQGLDEITLEVASGAESTGEVTTGPVNVDGYTLLRGPILSDDPDTSEPWTAADLSDATIRLRHRPPGS